MALLVHDLVAPLLQEPSQLVKEKGTKSEKKLIFIVHKEPKMSLDLSLIHI